MSVPKNWMRKTPDVIEQLIRAVADKVGNGATYADCDGVGQRLAAYPADEVKAGAARAGMTLSGTGKGDLIKQVVRRLKDRIGTYERTRFR